MSHHWHGYRIYPDDNEKIHANKWANADRWINGMAFREDFDEAVALAKIAVISCVVPFVVHEIAMGGIRQKESYAWIFN